MAGRAALSTEVLPAAGGTRPQILAIINYTELIAELRTATGCGTTESDTPASGTTVFGSAAFAFAGPVSAKTVRKMACDAEIIPVVLGGAGEVLDIGRARRLFPLTLRRALIARDKGCAFPGCTIPAAWTEAHHIGPWARGGVTGVGNGTLLCSHHHHLLHQNDWSIGMIHGIPWFTPPAYIDPARTPRRNTFWDIPAPPKPPPTARAA